MSGGRGEYTSSIAKESRPKAAQCGGMSFRLLQLFTGEFPQEVGRLARLAGGGEDGAVVLFQKRQPIIDVRGAAEFAVHAEVGAEERRGQLRDQLLGRIRLRTESIFQIAIKPGL